MWMVNYSDSKILKSCAVYRKHWYVIKNESLHMRRRLHTKLHKGSYKPNSPQPYLNPVFDEFDGGVIGRKISERKSSSTSHC